jgi:hypothetical protein
MIGPARLVLGLSAPLRVILGIGTLAGGGLAVYRLTQEVIESRTMGPPAWWVLWRRPLRPELPAQRDQKNVNHYMQAARVFRWVKDRWVPLTPWWYFPPKGAMGGGVSGGPPSERNIYAQAVAQSDGKTWKLKSVFYGRDTTKPLPK